MEMADRRKALEAQDPVSGRSSTASTSSRRAGAGAGGGSVRRRRAPPPTPAPSSPAATLPQLLSLLDTSTSRALFALGCIFGALGGLSYPALAHWFSRAFSSLSGAADAPDLSDVRYVSYGFLVIGTYAFSAALGRALCLGISSGRASRTLRTEWFGSLLRQDAAYYDVSGPCAVGGTFRPGSEAVRRALGVKFGEGAQFLSTVLGGTAYAFYSSWKVALVVVAALPLVWASVAASTRAHGGRAALAVRAYSGAGSVAHGAVSGIRGILSLNAVEETARRYRDATAETYGIAVRPLCYIGAANGAMLASFVVLYCVLTLYGAFLVYTDVRGTGCDPSASVPGSVTCYESGSRVLGSMLGAAFAGQGASQLPDVAAAIWEARRALYPALVAMDRTATGGGAEEREVVLTIARGEMGGRTRSVRVTEEGGAGSGGGGWTGSSGRFRVRAVLPRYSIDPSSPHGIRPPRSSKSKGGRCGAISFRAVRFSYPTHPGRDVLDDFSLTVRAGMKVAVVGERGSGKSTVASLLMRFYDPTFGAVTLDGVDLRDMNIRYHRLNVGYVGRSEVMFDGTVASNVRMGNLRAGPGEIESAVRRAGAHDFVAKLKGRYGARIGPGGVHLTGGQKQLIAVARALVGNPKVLIFDEIEAALPPECRLIVQKSLDKVLSNHVGTALVITHRIGAIRNSDAIAVIRDGRVVEFGTHDVLMGSTTSSGHYRALVEEHEVGRDVEVDLLGGGGGGGGDDDDSVVDADGGGGGGDGGAASDKSVRVRHILRFVDVDFAYPSRPNRRVLDGFNLNVRGGETLALVGPGDGGKSTAAALAERFYDPEGGSVLFCGVDMRELNVRWLRDRIGYITQDPPLIDGTIAHNISRGSPDTTPEEMEDACRIAGVLEDVRSLPDGFDSEVGGGTRQRPLSRSQRRRIAVAAALCRKPQILLVDEAADTEEDLLESLDGLNDTDLTVIVMTRKLSTMLDSDRVAFVADGKVKEIGTPEELMKREGGHCRRLAELERRRGSGLVLGPSPSGGGGDGRYSTKVEEEDEEDDEVMDVREDVEDEEARSFRIWKARSMAYPDAAYLLLGGAGAVLAGGVFPAWGVVFGLVLRLLFRRVDPCPLPEESGGGYPPGYGSCSEYSASVAEGMRETSFRLAGYWAAIVVCCLVGNVLISWAFGTASERLNKRVRDEAFRALLRQEVAYFDRRGTARITAYLRDDVTRMNSFSGEIIRVLVINLTSVAIGIAISVATMWPFAILAIATYPFMCFATSTEMKIFLGEGFDDDKDDGPGSYRIVSETLLNIRTVSALAIEKKQYDAFLSALRDEESNFVQMAFFSGCLDGLTALIQHWSTGLNFFWGGWLLFYYSHLFTFDDFVVSMFASLFSLFALGASAMAVRDRSECERSAGGIIHLLNRESAIDPMSDGGKNLDV